MSIEENVIVEEDGLLIKRFSSNFQKAWQWIIFTIPYSFSTSRKEEGF